MDIKDRILAFTQLGTKILTDEQKPETIEFWEAVNMAHQQNPWFTPAFCEYAIKSIATHWLTEQSLNQWVALYPKRAFNPKFEKRVGIVMAGNIPFVGFHDILCVLMAGHKLVGKISSKDAGLTQILLKLLLSIEPRFKDYITITEERLENFDAVIATGSNNTSRYFDYYFAKYPNIIRKNRQSIAIITGNETAEQFKGLASDIFSYFGLGCRNVSKLLIPKDYDLTPLIDNFLEFKSLVNHHKYANNYEYYRAIFLMNQIEHLDSGFALLKPDESLGSPVGVIYYQHYSDINVVNEYIDRHNEQLQCIVSSNLSIPNSIGFGQTQNPLLTDYADGIDTINFLASLNI
ncbi:MAG: acyl-CoA reductase [Bacteroidales bacterium]